jgi:histidinol-phosphate/aromatic aminotransferase/cobyric acid decarboxylase-like protein/N-acyl-L-homoserine lactone synthetase
MEDKIMNNTWKIRITIGKEEDRPFIYKLRHDVYAKELGQHPENSTGQLSDPLDAFNTYIIASTQDGEKIGFVSITPPGRNYSIDKYMSRDDLPFIIDNTVYEARILTVKKSYRGKLVVPLLMYAVLRWVESRGGKRIIGIGRSEIIEIYKRTGFRLHGRQVQSGAVKFELISATLQEANQYLGRYSRILNKLEMVADWQLGISFQKPTSSFHGGAFFDAIGDEFNQLDKNKEIINADVLDAWYPPSPKVIAALQEYTPWLLRTSPPTNCEGMIKTIARVRDIPSECVLVGAGSSDLIFLALRHWLKPSSRVLILDPCYGEYSHIFEKVIRCKVDRINLSRNNGYLLDNKIFEAYLKQPYDLIVIVNPNSPTGRHVSNEELGTIIQQIPSQTRVWVDETYIEYAGRNQSIEQLAVNSENVIVCKSMSKVYALSGVRAAYLAAAPHILEDLRSITHPWAVSLLGQVAAVKALLDPEYYESRYQETHALREKLVDDLSKLNAGLEFIPSIANFVLCHLPETGKNAKKIIEVSKEHGLFLRNANSMGTQIGEYAIRIAVKDSKTNSRMVEILKQVLV